MKISRSNKLALFTAVAVMSAASMAYGYYSALPQAQHEGSITYITGGIGDEERTALESVQKDYNLHVTNSARSGAFSGETEMVIYDKVGNPVVSTDAGPLFYAQLPAGKYVIAAENNGAEQKKEVKVHSGSPVDLHFRW